jgi:diketogulonate reductase-like aldo/keto reductase
MELRLYPGGMRGRLPSAERRRVIGALVALGAGTVLPATPTFAQSKPFITRPIPSSGEAMPVVGLGSWITFNVGNDRVARDSCADVMRNFFAAGGRMIDSSPMYGSSQDVIGYGLSKLGRPPLAFSADKVWISSGSAGRAQIEKSRERWGVARFDLVAVHNLLSWQEHLPVLFAMKAAGQIRYVGVTTSEGRRHQEIEEIMRRQPLDFVQVSYSAVERDVETRILPLARDRGIAVVINRPFREGTLIRSVKRQPLPSWAAEADCANWSEFLLKFIVSHPAVLCAIPATTSVAHVRENMGAGLGRLPDESLRRRMAAYVEQL